ncbi:hypothetical protein HOV00_gp39 [Microbacterium phage Schubert]|uniref:Uncharacterized protein n=1 Tax=Microbacterium phage Schubert TaxID=2500787 RepID=A0A3Q9RAA4_9CAUD|nr:hypothetical protein HOV00_gp39 [Microbacterium phage Schubert]AZV01760.1 hypothetical protein SEA_SCHUBERT_54 [Microbacterium phage Schubert]
MNNEARILDHTTTVFSTDLVLDHYGYLAPRTVTVEGIEFVLGDNGYENLELGVTLYLESTEDARTADDVWYAQIDPIS